MPDRYDRMLLLVGLALHALALVGIFALGPTDRTQTSIDHTHWLLLVGATLQLPFAVNLREGPRAVVAAVAMTGGLVATIGMCVIDFVFWSLTDAQLEAAVAAELRATPSVWTPFMLYGPEELLYAGFALASLRYWRSGRVGTVLVVSGAVLAIAGPGWFNVAGALCVFAGFVANFSARSADRGGLRDT